MHIYGIIRFKTGEIRWVSILTEKELKAKHKEDQVLDHSFSVYKLGHSNYFYLLKGMKVETELIFSFSKYNLWTINFLSRTSDYLSVFHILSYVYKLETNLKLVVVKYLVYMLKVDMLSLQCKSLGDIFENLHSHLQISIT